MDQEIQQLFRNVESGRVDLLPKLGALLNRAGLTRNAELLDDCTAQIPAPGLSPPSPPPPKYYFYFDTLEELHNARFKGAVYLPWTPPPIGQIVERLQPELEDIEYVNRGKRIMWGRVVAAVTNARYNCNHCSSCRCSDVNTSLGWWIIHRFRSDGSEYSDYQLDLFKNIEPPCFLLPIKE